MSQLRGPSPTSEQSASGQADTPLRHSVVNDSICGEPDLRVPHRSGVLSGAKRISRAIETWNEVFPYEALSLQVELSAPAYVYVVNEDENGESYLAVSASGPGIDQPSSAGTAPSSARNVEWRGDLVADNQHG